MIRKPAVAGRFYPADMASLKRDMEKYIDESDDKISARCIMVPHAGYVFSGATAGKVYGAVELSSSFVVLCPNHTGRGRPFSIMSRGAWETPLGDAPIDEKGADNLKELCSMVEEDDSAHAYEHSLEVQIPFLQYLKEDFSFIPICVAEQNRDRLANFGECLHEYISGPGKDSLLIVSTDMTHFESAQSAREKDMDAIDRIKELDTEGFADVIARRNISMCGWAPSYAALKAMVQLGAERAELLDYSNSADVTGDTSEVVGYAGMVVR